MKIYRGKTVYKGIAMGRITVLKKDGRMVRRVKVEDWKKELSRMESARLQAMEQLGELYEKAVREVGEASASIFEIHQMMLEDDDYLDSIRSMIEREQVNAEYAVTAASDNFAQMFSSMEDEYMQARAADIRDISERLIQCLTGENGAFLPYAEPRIIVAQDLTPSETVQMDKEKILAFVTVQGSANSHTAILARMMNIPALIGVELDLNALREGDLAIVDGFEETFALDPDSSRIASAQKAMDRQKEKLQLLQTLRGKETQTLDGTRIKLYANIGSLGDMAYAMENDAEGIGLFRSEFLYLGRDHFPTESEQFQTYRQAVQMMGGKQLIIRTMDIGADKQVDYFHLEQETNPAMGYRAIRICLKQPDIFKTQLRALLQAAAFGEIQIMYPMITSVEEVLQIKKLVEETHAQLEQEGMPCQIPPQGIMIETPAAALISDQLAPLVDFFSIGTNDLTQYTLAIDRQNPKLDDFYQPHHPAVLKLIQMAVEHAHRHGIWVGICGELGADLELTETFLKMGVDELSVSPSMILRLRKKIRELDLSQNQLPRR